MLNLILNTAPDVQNPESNIIERIYVVWLRHSISTAIDIYQTNSSIAALVSLSALPSAFWKYHLPDTDLIFLQIAGDSLRPGWFYCVSNIANISYAMEPVSSIHDQGILWFRSYRHKRGGLHIETVGR